VKLFSAIPYTELIDYYSSYEFYFQLSVAEGFPNALCEAMLCGCVPIGSNVFSIPKIIGDSGFVLQKKDTSQLSLLISQALQSDKSNLSAKARKRITENFPLENRKKLLLNLVQELLSRKK
jgi:glycosyltransferase involved in cell wall biosynthesis